MPGWTWGSMFTSQKQHFVPLPLIPELQVWAPVLGRPLKGQSLCQARCLLLGVKEACASAPVPPCPAWPPAIPSPASVPLCPPLEAQHSLPALGTAPEFCPRPQALFTDCFSETTKAISAPKRSHPFLMGDYSPQSPGSLS